MKLNRQSILDISTAHLSRATLDYIDTFPEGAPVSIAQRDEGFMIATIHAEYDPEISKILPPDLILCLRFAKVNGMDYVLFDSDAMTQEGLPIYGHGLKPEEGTAYIGSDLDIDIYSREELTDDMLRITETPVLEEGDYEAPDGLWLGIGDASVRVSRDDQAVTVSIHPRGLEMSESEASTFMLLDDLSYAISREGKTTEENVSP